MTSSTPKHPNIQTPKHRIALATSIPPTVAGGVERQVTRLVDELAGRGQPVDVFAASDEQLGRHVSHLWGTKLVRQSQAMARRIQAAGDYDTVICNGLFGPLSWPQGRRICWFHSCLRAYAQGVGEWMRPQYRWITSQVLGGREARACREGMLVAVSAGVGEELRRLYGARDVRVIPNGVDLDHFTPGPRDELYLQSLGVPEGKPVLVYVGRWEKAKGVDVVLALAEALGEQASIIAAVGGTADAVPADSGVIVAGDVPWADLPRLYRSADALISPSYYEGFGLAMAEAAACGIPLIARETGCAADFIQDTPDYRKTILPHAASVTDFLSAAQAVLQDEPFRQNLAAAGRATAVARYNERNSLTQLADLITA